MAITPNREQFVEYAKSDLDGEVVMLNLLRFARTGASDEESGAAAYGRYSDQVIKMVEAQGGTIVWSGRPHHVFIGDPEADRWDAAVLVMYPSREKFMEMVSTPEYNEAHEDRESGLEATVVLACEPAPLFRVLDG